MPKKIILTEQQFDKLQQFRFETKFEDFISKNAKVNDIIRIEFKNSVNNFKVISNDDNRIQMDNIDAGSANINNRYFIASTGLNGNRIEIRKVNKTKEANKLNDIKSVINFLLSEEYEFKSFVIYNLYRDIDFVYLRFATIDDISAVIRENRNKKIDNILNGK
jgi:hypothetical protein